MTNNNLLDKQVRVDMMLWTTCMTLWISRINYTLAMQSFIAASSSQQQQQKQHQSHRGRSCISICVCMSLTHTPFHTNTWCECWCSCVFVCLCAFWHAYWWFRRAHVCIVDTLLYCSKHMYVCIHNKSHLLLL